MKLNKLKVDYVYKAIHYYQPDLNETLVVTKMDNYMEAVTLQSDDFEFDMPLGWILLISKPCDYNFILLGHKDKFPEFFL